MLIETVILIDYEPCTQKTTTSLIAALVRRGWDPLGDGQFRTAISETDSDELERIDDHVVQIVERDVKQAAYVAGVKDYEVVCLLKSDQPFFENDFEPDDVGSGIDFA